MKDNKETLSSQIKDTFNDYFSNTSHLIMDDDNRKKLFRKLVLIIVCMFALEVVDGLVRFEGIMHNTFIIILYVLELLVIFALANGLFTLTTHYKAMIDKEIKKSATVFPSYTIVLIVFCAISFIASIVFVISNGFNNDVYYFVIYLLSKIAIGLLSYYFRYLTLDLEFKQDKNNE